MLSALAVNAPLRATRIAISVLFFAAGFCFASWASRIPDIQHKLGMSDAALGAVLLSLPVGLMLSLPISGILVARLGSKGVALVGVLLYTTVLIFLGLAVAKWQLMLVLFAFGLSGNLLNISMNAQAVTLEGLYKRSIMASFHGIWSLGGFTGAAVGALMVRFSTSTAIHFSIVAAMVFAAVAMVPRFLLATESATERAPIFAKPDSSLLKLGLIAFCCMICEGTMFDWSGIYFTKVVQAPKELTTLGYVAFMSTMSGGRFAGDWLSTTLGKKTMIRLSGLLIFTGLLIAVLFPGIVWATVGFLITGIGVSSVVPLVYGAAGRNTKFNSGIAIAAVSTIGYLGFLFGPPLVGFIAEAASLRWSFAVVAVLGFSATLIAGYSDIKD